MQKSAKINLPKNTILKPANEAGFCSQSFYIFLVERAGVKPATSAMRMPRSIS